MSLHLPIVFVQTLFQLTWIKTDYFRVISIKQKKIIKHNDYIFNISNIIVKILNTTTFNIFQINQILVNLFIPQSLVVTLKNTVLYWNYTKWRTIFFAYIKMLEMGAGLTAHCCSYFNDDHNIICILTLRTWS